MHAVAPVEVPKEAAHGGHRPCGRGARIALMVAPGEPRPEVGEAQGGKVAQADRTAAMAGHEGQEGPQILVVAAPRALGDAPLGTQPSAPAGDEELEVGDGMGGQGGNLRLTLAAR